MFKMIEVVGTSPISYADATKSAVDQIAQETQVFWFEVVELRGGVRNGEIEFQVKLKVATK